MCSMASRSLFTTDQVCLHPLLSLELSTSSPSRRSFDGVLGMSARLRTRRLAMYHISHHHHHPPLPLPPPPPPPLHYHHDQKGRVDNSLYRCAFWCWEKCSTAGITDPSDCVFGADSDTHCYCGSGFNATAAYGHNSVPKKQQKKKTTTKRTSKRLLGCPVISSTRRRRSTSRHQHLLSMVHPSSSNVC